MKKWDVVFCNKHNYYNQLFDIVSLICCKLQKIFVSYKKHDCSVTEKTIQ